MNTLKMHRPGKVTWDYDREADTLYISFGKPVPALTMDLGGGLLARYIKDTGELVGFTIAGVRKMVGTG
ncbi:MAG: DUF2283 domain-containing protein [Chloroflexi bacterium]|nr:DUF2283 domain-containing protein [Chloroflexota bacterium]